MPENDVAMPPPVPSSARLPAGSIDVSDIISGDAGPTVVLPTFRRRFFRRYRAKEVDAALAELAVQVADFRRVQAELVIARMTNTLLAVEENIRRMQEQAAREKAAANGEVGRMLEKAREKGEEMLADARTELRRLNGEVQRIRDQATRLLREFAPGSDKPPG